MGFCANEDSRWNTISGTIIKPCWTNWWHPWLQALNLFSLETLNLNNQLFVLMEEHLPHHQPYEMLSCLYDWNTHFVVCNLFFFSFFTPYVCNLWPDKQILIVLGLMGATDQQLLASCCHIKQKFCSLTWILRICMLMYFILSEIKYWINNDNNTENTIMGTEVKHCIWV